MERVDEAPSVAAGYQEPDVDGHYLDEENLRRIIDHDEEVVWFILNHHDVFADGEIHAHQWAAANTVGNAVGDSRRLRGLSIQGFHDDEDLEVDVDGADTWLSNFLLGLAHNRSIVHFGINGDCFSYNPIEIISPFIVHNRNLRCIEITSCDLSEYFPSFLLALSACKTNQLERIHLHDNFLEGKQVTRYMKALCKQRNLREIYLKDNGICQSGFVELSRLLQLPHSKIHSLEIGDTSGDYPLIDDECITILTRALVANKTLKVLDVGGRGITAIGWRVFSAVLCSPIICSLESLTLSDLNDEGAAIIGESLAKKNTLNSLKLSATTCITLAGWQELLKCLRNSKCALRELDVDYGMDRAGAIVTAGSLEANSSLKILKIDFSSITATGCVEFFNGILYSTCFLKELHLADIEDQGAAALVDLLASMSTLRLLELRCCHSITTNVWRAFARVLQNGSTVKMLEIDGSNLNDEVAIDFATGLARNSSLSKLRIGGRVFTDRIWGAFNRILDASCIESTYLSNHTLHTLHVNHWEGNPQSMVVPEELDRVLKMNTHEDKVAVARRKIIAYHFSGDIVDIQEFASMAEPKLPHAIEWIGRDPVHVSLMYHVTRGISALFERNAYAKFAGGKRKNPSLD